MHLPKLVVVLCCLIVADVGVAADPPLKLATFRVDVTPPIGDGPCVGCMPKVRIGDLDIVHLPGEPFVEFQLFAQEIARPNSFTCVAGYGECGVWYYGPDRIFTDRGGYEQTWSLTGPCEQTVKTALTRLLEK